MKKKTKIGILLNILIVIVGSLVFYNQQGKVYKTDYFSFRSNKELKDRIIKLDDSEGNMWGIFEIAKNDFSFLNEKEYSSIQLLIRIEKDKNEAEFNEFIKKYMEENNGYEKTEIGKKKYKISAKTKSGDEVLYVFYIEKKIVCLNFLLPNKGEKNKSLDIDRIVKTFKLSNNDISDNKKVTYKRTFSKSEALEECNELYKALKINPGLYLYRTKFETEKDFKNLIEKMNSKAEWKITELYAEYSKFISKIGDGHTYFETYPEELSRSPFQLKLIIRNKEFFIKNDEFYKLGGAKLIKINDVSVNDIYEKMKKLLSYDRGFDSAMEEKMSHDFYWLFPLLYENTRETKIEYFSNGKIYKKYLDNKKRVKEPSRSEKTFEYSIDKEKNAILKINTFIPLENKKELKNKLKKIEKEKLKNLIVDIRGNRGGYQDIPELFLELLKNIEKINGKEKNVYVLVNRSSFSASVYLQFLARINNITILGENSGGNLNTLCTPVAIELKKSKFNFNSVSN